MDICTCAGNSQCENSDFVSGEAVCKDLHHTNLANILFRVPLPDATSDVMIAFTGHTTCVNISGNHVIHGASGVAVEAWQVLTVVEFGPPAFTKYTLVHEFGHLYGVDDHYHDRAINIGTDYDDNCIYGLFHNESEVYENLLLCDHCRAIIEANKSRFD